jgi:hypothetical protein
MDGTLFARTIVLALALVAFASPGGAQDDHWTPWLNRDHPAGVGDYETLKDFLKEEKACPAPLAIECRTVRGMDWNQAGQSYICDPAVGGVCRNSEQESGLCEDYEVRFLCSGAAVSPGPWAPSVAPPSIHPGGEKSVSGGRGGGAAPREPRGNTPWVRGGGPWLLLILPPLVVLLGLVALVVSLTRERTEQRLKGKVGAFVAFLLSLMCAGALAGAVIGAMVAPASARDGGFGTGALVYLLYGAIIGGLVSPWIAAGIGPSLPRSVLWGGAGVIMIVVLLAMAQ